MEILTGSTTAFYNYVSMRLYMAYSQWENGGEDKEIDNYVDGTVEYYDDWSTWEELNW